MRIVAEHLPVFVARDERDLLDGKASFEETTCLLLPQVVEMKVFDIEGSALAPERCSHRPSIVGEEAPAFIVGEDAPAALADTRPLLFNCRPGVVARDVEQRDALVIAAPDASRLPQQSG
jgi:hypothetical protein